MNRAFINKKEIVLDKNYIIKPCSNSNGVELICTEVVERYKVTGRGSKRVTTDDIETATLVKIRYFTRIAQALNFYTEKTTNTCEDFKTLISKTDQVINLLEKIDKEFSQFP